MGQEQFLLDRQKGIGGSDVAAIMGLSPWKTPLDVYLEKTMPVPENDDFEPITDKPQLARGKRCEKYILEEYADRTGQTLMPGRLVRHPQHPFLQGHVDAFVEGENVLVEAKSVGGSPNSWKDEIPPYYKTQIAHYAMVTNCERVDVPVLFDRWQYACFTYYRDTAFEEQVFQACLDFWDKYVLKENPPPPQNLKDVQALYPRHEPLCCPLTEEIEDDVEGLKILFKARKQLIECEEKLKVRVMDYMKHHEALMDGTDVLVTWKNQKRSVLDTGQLKAEHPLLYKQYQKDQTTRVFRLKGQD